MNRARIIGFAIACAVMLVIMLVVSRCMAEPARQEAAAAKVDASLSDARAASGQDAVGAVAAAGAREAESEQLTRENDNAIHSALGAGAPVNAGVADAGRRGLCRRAAYRDSEQCKRLLSARP
jgi:hypothetical protein